MTRNGRSRLFIPFLESRWSLQIGKYKRIELHPGVKSRRKWRERFSRYQMKLKKLGGTTFNHVPSLFYKSEGLFLFKKTRKRGI